MSAWELKNLVYDCTARNNEEYRVELKKRMRTLTVLFGLGLLTLAVTIGLILQQPELMESFRAGLFSGIGTGLMLGSALGMFYLKSKMKDEESLKAARLAETDEREREISNKALRATAKVMLVVLYLIMLVCIFISDVAVIVMCALIMLFFVCYMVCRKIYSKLM